MSQRGKGFGIGLTLLTLNVAMFNAVIRSAYRVGVNVCQFEKPLFLLISKVAIHHSFSLSKKVICIYSNKIMATSVQMNMAVYKAK